MQITPMDRISNAQPNPVAIFNTRDEVVDAMAAFIILMDGWSVTESFSPQDLVMRINLNWAGIKNAEWVNDYDFNEVIKEAWYLIESALFPTRENTFESDFSETTTT